MRNEGHIGVGLCIYHHMCVEPSREWVVAADGF